MRGEQAVDSRRETDWTIVGRVEDLPEPPRFRGRLSLLLVPIFRQALLGAVIFVWQKLAGHQEPHAVPLRVREPVDLEVEVDRRHDAVAELLLDQRLQGGA